MSTRQLKPLDAPLSEWERNLFQRVTLDDLSPALRAELTDHVSLNAPHNVSSITNLKGEEWREVGATGNPAFGTKIIRLKGLVTKTGTPAGSDVIFTLPEGYCPALRSVFTVATGETTAFGRIDVLVNGQVHWMAGATGETDFTSLEAISFRAA